MEKSIKSIATNYGLYLGAFLAVATVLAYALNLELFTKWWFGIILLIAVIVFGIISTAKTKSALNGIISFKEAFTSYFITILIGILVSSVVSILIFTVIDPDSAVVLQEKILNMQVENMRNFGQSEEVIAEMVKKAEEQGNMYSPLNVLKSVAYQLVGFSIVGLIVALVMRKKEETDFV